MQARATSAASAHAALHRFPAGASPPLVHPQVRPPHAQPIRQDGTLPPPLLPSHHLGAPASLGFTSQARAREEG